MNDESKVAIEVHKIRYIYNTTARLTAQSYERHKAQPRNYQHDSPPHPPHPHKPINKQQKWHTIHTSAVGGKKHEPLLATSV